MLKPLIAAALLVAAPALQAQVRVVDSQPLSPSNDSENQEGGGNTVQTEMYFQLQSLQQEVLELRGLVEEQSHEIQRLKQQRMDDYLDLDSRIGALTQGGGSGAGSLSLGAAGRGDSDADDSQTGGSQRGSDERATETEKYREAYELLRDRDIDQAIAAFNSYLEEYPEGNFAGNSHYWLGEIYLLQEDLDEAQKWFERLLEQYPDDRKRADTQYKLGRVYHQQGKDDRARELLQEVASGVSDAARLARQYLEENF